MCGICGIIAPEGQKPVPEHLTAMAQAIGHRGPDGRAFHLRERAGLGHCRLAIIDLDTGSQPMANEDQSLWIVFNGEIYNFKALRDKLEGLGHVFATRSDTEVILHAYEQYGPACLDELRGMFAFAIWDANRQQLFAARDRLGKKPFYYALHQGHLLFASEPPALLNFPGLSREPDFEALGHFLSLQYVPDPMSAFKAIRKLPPGHHLTWADGALRLWRYWRLDFEPKWPDSEEDLAQELRERLTEAVRLRLVAEVPLGVHLSGGLDSSIVTALMAKLSDRPVKTFSIGFAEQAFTELPKARLVAKRYATDHHEFVMEYPHVPTTLEHVIWHTGEPLADPAALPGFHLARLTRQHVTVALNGDGGDELFAGYQRYWLDRWARYYSALPRAVTQRLVPAALGLVAEPQDRPIETNWLAGLKRLAQVARISPKASIVRWGSYFTPQAARELWRPELNPHTDSSALLARIFDTAPARNFLDRSLAVDMAAYLPGDLLVKADRMAMAHGLEGRSPLLDQDLAQWAARLPANLKLRGRTGKYLLRKACADLLPTGACGQGKQGFGLPVGLWLRGELHPWCRETLLAGVAAKRLLEPKAVKRLLDEHRQGRVDHGKRLWALLSLEMWLRIFEPI